MPGAVVRRWFCNEKQTTPVKMSINLLYLSFARSACSSVSAYIATTPGVESGIFVATRFSFGTSGSMGARTKRYLLRPIDRMIHDFFGPALDRIFSGRGVR